MKNFDSNDDKEPKNPGLRGDTFRVYQEEAKLFLMEKFIKDDNSSGWELILGIDQGGTQPGAPAMPNAQTMPWRMLEMGTVSRSQPSEPFDWSC